MTKNTDAGAFNIMMLGQADLCINGGMEISQENGTSLLSLTNNTAKYTVDQWIAKYNNSTIVMTAQQISATPTPPSGFKYAHQMKSTTGAALGSGDYALLQQAIEGQRISKLGWGASGATPITISFWIYATIAGTGTLTIQNYNGSRSYPVNFTINAGTTWEYKQITIPGDTTGTWATDNTVGMYVVFGLGIGSTYQGTNATWSASNVFGTSSTTNFFASNNNVVCVTGVSVLPGSQGPNQSQAGWMRRHYDDELKMCLRYYWKDDSPSGTVQFFTSIESGGATYRFMRMPFPVRMRTAPTVSLTATTSGSFGGGFPSLTAASTDFAGIRGDVTTATDYSYIYGLSGNYFIANARM